MRSLPRRSRRVLGAAAVAALVLGGWTAVEAQSTPGANPPSPAPTPQVDTAAVRAAVAGGKTESYTGVTPCRIIDTRLTTPLNSATRSFDVSGNLSAQGGKATGCNIPTNATSIAVNLTGISRGGAGFVRGWAGGGSEPQATLLNFSTALNASNQVNIPLCRAGACPDAFILKSYGNLNLVADVVGFYEAPMYAAVSPSGTIYGGVSSGVVSVAKNSTGNYTITLDRPTDGCSALASSITWATNIDASPDMVGGLTNTVQVGLANTSNAAVDAYFYVEVTC